MESIEARIKRLKSNAPDEAIGNILNAICNSYLPELSVAAQEELSNSLILGIHSIASTVAEHIFLRRGKSGFKFYLENFVDGEDDDLKFSNISGQLYDWRNVIAHQFLSGQGHMFGYNYKMNSGYKVDNGVTLINPYIFFTQVKNAFENYGQARTKYKVYDYMQLLTTEEMQKSKDLFLDTFLKSVN